MRLIRIVLTSAGIVSMMAATGSAQVFESVGTRAMGMGGAFVAVADDATAAYWNPAGLVTGAFLSMLVDHTAAESRRDASRPDAPGADGIGTFVGLTTNAVGLSYYRIRINQVGGLVSAPDGSSAGNELGAPVLRSLILHNVALSGAQLLSPGVSLGSTLRYVRASYGTGAGEPGSTTGAWLDAADGLERRGQHRADLDLGLKFGSQTIQGAVVARNLLQPTLSGPDGREIRLDTQARAGVAFNPAGRLTLAADVDLTRLESVTGDRRNVAVGVEHWFADWIGMRGGARFNLEEDEPRAVGAFGLSIALTTGVFLDGQVTRGRDQVERGWSVAGRFGF